MPFHVRHGEIVVTMDTAAEVADLVRMLSARSSVASPAGSPEPVRESAAPVRVNRRRDGATSEDLAAVAKTVSGKSQDRERGAALPRNIESNRGSSRRFNLMANGVRVRGPLRLTTEEAQADLEFFLKTGRVPPVPGRRCSKCREVGHYARACRNEPSPPTADPTPEDVSDVPATDDEATMDVGEPPSMLVVPSIVEGRTREVTSDHASEVVPGSRFVVVEDFTEEDDHFAYLVDEVWTATAPTGAAVDEFEVWEMVRESDGCKRSTCPALFPFLPAT